MSEIIYISKPSVLFQSKARALFFGRDQARGAIVALVVERGSHGGHKLADLEEQGWDDFDEYAFLGSDTGWENLRRAGFFTLADLAASSEYTVDQHEMTVRLRPLVTMLPRSVQESKWVKHAFISVPWHVSGFIISNVDACDSWHLLLRDRQGASWKVSATDFGWGDLSRSEISEKLTALLLAKAPHFFRIPIGSKPRSTRRA